MRELFTNSLRNISGWINNSTSERQKQTNHNYAIAHYNHATLALVLHYPWHCLRLKNVSIVI